MVISLLATLALVLGTSPCLAENIDPDDDGSQFAYAENLGWINAEPINCADCGLQVGDPELAGWLWGENVGWVNPSCANTGSCAAVEFRVTNDGCGNLAGYAWAENVGWISFTCGNTSNCATVDYGVTIDPQTGSFSGRAWAENVGWITFAAQSPVEYGVKTDWRGIVPSGLVSFSGVGKTSTQIQLSWSAVPDAAGYDVLRGRLADLRSSSGDFSVAIDDCVAEDHSAVTLNLPLASGSNADFFLVRPVHCGGAGTADSGGSSQVASRDLGIEAAPNACQ